MVPILVRRSQHKLRQLSEQLYELCGDLVIRWVSQMSFNVWQWIANSDVTYRQRFQLRNPELLFEPMPEYRELEFEANEGPQPVVAREISLKKGRL